MLIENHRFIVTGAASGLGAATATLLVNEGGQVVLVDSNAEAGAAMASQLGEAASFIAADVTRESDAAAVVTLAKQQGGVDGLIHCAGTATAASLLGRQGVHPLAAFERTITINLIGSFNMVRLVADAMQHNTANADGERGVIIMTASIAAFDGQIGQVAYAASKGGVVAMTLPLARELARHGIRVLTIAPGTMETPMMAGFSDEVKSSLAAAVPFPKRLGRSDEFAALVAHLCRNPYLNGEVIRLDGALRMAAR